MTFDAAPASGIVVTLERLLPLERVTDFIEGGDFSARAINTELDYLTASAEQLAEAHRHAEVMAGLQTQENKAAYEQVNQSLRAEIASGDPYVRRMRPTFGYLMAITWTVQMSGLAYIMTFRTEQAASVLTAMDSLAAIWAMGLSVLGIYVYKRSEEKKMAPPQNFPVLKEKRINPLPAPKPAQFND